MNDPGPHGRTGGVYRIVDQVVARHFAGRRIRVRLRARPAETDRSAEFAVAYSTNDVGNSGWRRFTVAPGSHCYVFEWDVPPARRGNAHFLGIWADTSGCGGGIVVEHANIAQVAKGEATMQTPRPVPLLIVGPQSGVQHLLHALDPQCVDVRGIIGPEEGAAFGLRSVSFGEIRSSPDLHTVPIVVARDFNPNPAQFDVHDPRKEFLGTFNLLRQEQQLPNRILHPLALCELFQAHLTGFVHTVGLPGSGNVLTGRIIEAVRRFSSPDPGRHERGSAEWYMLEAGREYRGLIYDHFWSLFLRFGALGVTSRPSHYRHVDFVIELPERRLIYILNIPDAWHLVDTVRATHTVLYAQDRTAMRACGVLPVNCIRHPLDTFVSMARKWDGSKISPSTLLQSPEWVDFCAGYMAAYQNEMMQSDADGLLVRYEDLLVEPSRAIRRIGDVLDVDLSDEQALRIWDELAFRPLNQADPRHFRGGGQNRWPAHLSATQLGLLASHNVLSLGAALGYETADILAEPTVPLHQPFSVRRSFGLGPVPPGVRRQVLCFSENEEAESIAASILSDRTLGELLDSAALQTEKSLLIERRDLWPMGGSHPPVDSW